MTCSWNELTYSYLSRHIVVQNDFIDYTMVLVDNTDITEDRFPRVIKETQISRIYYRIRKCYTNPFYALEKLIDGYNLTTSIGKTKLIVVNSL